MVTIKASVGVGAWKAQATGKLVAVPHVGDTVELYGLTFTCERVHITNEAVWVQCLMRWESEQSYRDWLHELDPRWTAL